MVSLLHENHTWANERRSKVLWDWCQDAHASAIDTAPNVLSRVEIPISMRAAQARLSSGARPETRRQPSSFLNMFSLRLALQPVLTFQQIHNLCGYTGTLFLLANALGYLASGHQRVFEYFLQFVVVNPM